MEEVSRFENYDITNIITPINVNILERLLRETSYDKLKTKYLVQGFKTGFYIGYRGPELRRDLSENIPIRVGSQLEMWNKFMKEVKLGCYVGPFCETPFDNYMQSPIGLVLKDN